MISTLYLTVADVIFIYFTLLFALACILKNYAIADIGWGWGFVITTLFCAYTTQNNSMLFFLTAGMVLLWGCRLSTYIYFRNSGKPEDFRYRQLREKWKRFQYLQAYIKLFITQAIIMLITSTCIIVASETTFQPNLASWFFCGITLIGLLYESVSDYQLVQFKKLPENRGKIMTQGLWRYSRHPNYFGEIIFWWGLSLMVATGSGEYIALISGLTINLLIVYVSGVPMLEAKYKNIPAYADYMRSTNTLLPLYFR